MSNPKDPNWAEAKAKGEKYYSTGKPCRRGHLAMRTIVGRSCVECDRLFYKPKKSIKLLDRNRNLGKREMGIRQAALERGDSHYFTGRPCVNGHVDWRATVGKDCVSCSRERAREYTRKRKGREPYFTGVPCPRGHLSFRRGDNSSCIECNREKKRIEGDRYAQATPPWADREEMIRIYNGRPEGYHVDHIIPLKHDLVCGLHIPTNLQYLPAAENIRKRNHFEPLFA